MRLESRRTPVISPNVINMVDIMLILFVFLIMSASFSNTDISGLEVNLPKAATAKAQEHSHFIVTVKADGRLLFNDKQVSYENLNRHVQQSLAQDASVLAVIYADESVTYSELIRVMDAIRMTGLERVALAADLKGKADTVK